MTQYVISFDHTAYDPHVKKIVQTHHVLRPTAFLEQAEATKKNLELNSAMSNVKIDDADDSQSGMF